MSRPHVVMLVSNDSTTDSRVRKTALAVAAAGPRVTLVALSPDGPRLETTLGAVRILRVPVEFALRDATRERAVRRRAAGVPFLRPLPPGRESVLRRRLVARQRDLAAAGSRLVPLRLNALRARRYGGRLGAKVSRAFWGGSDRALSKVAVGARWRSVLPEVDDYELAFGPVVDALAPDLIYAHDVQLLPVAARAVERARRAGRRIPWVYDAHEWVPGLSRYGSRTRRVVAAWADLEAEYIGAATAVVTVSDELAGALQRRHRLADRPAVVHNIPPMADEPSLPAAPDVRAAAGVRSDVPLLVYSGGITRARGVETAITALGQLPGVHLAVVAVPSAGSAGAQRLRVFSEQLGVGDRVHLLDPVAPQLVVPFLRTADLGLIPLRHFGSHEFALANKLFEYLHAGLPMVVSDCRAQAHFVEAGGFGRVHRADDAESLADAVSEVLAHRDEFAGVVRASPLRRDLTWPTQALALQELIARVLGPEGVEPAFDPSAGIEPGPEVALSRTGRSLMLGIGRTNSAGQGWAWAQAVTTRWPQARTEVVAIVNGKYDYPNDVAVSPRTFNHDPTWGLNLREHAREEWTHAIIEAGRPLFGRLGGEGPEGDIAALRAAGVRVGLVFHGSEVRSPREHARTHEFSPFGNARDPYTQKLQATADRNITLAGGFDGPVFVSTPDQLDYLPQASWLPVCIDLAQWPLQQRDRAVPLVVHAPSNPVLKGTEAIERALQPFVDAGRIEYQRVSGLPPHEAAELIRGADIVVDQVLLGLYGVLACEAMASGAVVLGHVGDSLRARVPQDVPVVEVTPRTLADEVDRVLENLASYREGASGRRQFVETLHDGCYAAGVLEPFLGADDVPVAAPTEVQ